MTTSLDTNIIVALWDRDTAINTAAQSALDSAAGDGALVISALVFAELVAAPSRSERFVDAFARDSGVMSNGFCSSTFGGPLDAPTRAMRLNEGNSAILGHDAFWPTS